MRGDKLGKWSRKSCLETYVHVGSSIQRSVSHARCGRAIRAFRNFSIGRIDHVIAECFWEHQRCPRTLGEFESTVVQGKRYKRQVWFSSFEDFDWYGRSHPSDRSNVEFWNVVRQQSLLRVRETSNCKFIQVSWERPEIGTALPTSTYFAWNYFVSTKYSPPTSLFHVTQRVTTKSKISLVFHCK